MFKRDSIGCLLPIHLHIRKLSWRASFRTATLSATHPARSLMGAEYRGAADTHDAAISQLTDRQLAKVRGTIVDAQDALAPLSDVFEPCASEARPGQRLLDLYLDRVGFHHRKDFPKAETPPPSPGGSDVAARMMWLHDYVVEGASSPVSHLDEWREKALSERHTMIGITSCSVPANKQFQSTCGWALQHGQTEWIHRTVAGRFRTPDAELTAIRFAIEGALQLEGITRIVIFTSHLSSAKLACDPSVHSSQGVSLAVCRALLEWFAEVPEATIDFVDVQPLLAGHHIKVCTTTCAPSLECLAFVRRSLTILSARGRRMKSTRPGDARSSGTRPMLGGSSST